MNYLFRENKIRIFELALISAAVIFAVSIIGNSSSFFPSARVAKSVSLTLKPGWNLISLPFNGYTAKSFCESYLDTMEVDRFYNNTWIKYECLDPQTENFPLVAHEAYFVKQDSPEHAAYFTGKTVKAKARFSQGWNSWVSPSQSRYQTASDLCKSSPDRQYSVLEVSRWAFGDWNTHKCGQVENNFPITENTVYFVLASSTADEIAPMMLVTPE